MQKTLLIGITGNSVVHTDRDNFDVDTRFRMAKAAGFDYYDKTPPTGELELYQQASEKHGLPIRAGGFYYTYGRDEPLLEWHLRMAKVVGSVAQNVQIKTKDVNGKPVTDAQVAETYLFAAELGDKIGVTPCFEVHINMWSEHYGRVSRVGELVERRGVKFNITLDPSHVIFKINNPREQDVQNMRADVEAGRVVLDPFKTGNVASEWITRNYVAHAHARPAAPANPVNIWAKHPDGSFGRGAQYPFIKPGPGEWHAEWHEERLDAWKEVMRQLLTHHAGRADSALGQISMEIIPAPDYGGGAKYSLLDNNVACANWLRALWKTLQPPVAVTA
jgi:hypothetical protein